MFIDRFCSRRSQRRRAAAAGGRLLPVERRQVHRGKGGGDFEIDFRKLGDLALQ